MKIIDISWPLTDKTTTYKNKDDIKFKLVKTFDHDKVRETQLSFGTHTGTHVDAPSHFIEDGKTVDQVALGTLVGQARVIDCTQLSDAISADFLAECTIDPGDIVLFKTRNSEQSPYATFDYQFIYVSSDAAAYLVTKQVKAVGIDYLGIERDQQDHETHIRLMNHDITIIEELRLSKVQPGHYFLICLPLAVVGLDAAPARALLVLDE